MSRPARVDQGLARSVSAAPEDLRDIINRSILPVLTQTRDRVNGMSEGVGDFGARVTLQTADDTSTKAAGLLMPDDCIWRLHVVISGRSTTGEIALWEYVYRVSKATGAQPVIDATAALMSDAPTDATWTFSVTTQDDEFENVLVNVQGGAGDTVSWYVITNVAEIEIPA